MGRKVKGNVVGRIIEVRFAASGKLASVKKYTGDLVKKGELLASLDRKIAQIELDRQLADYEKTRAEFEIYHQKNSGNDDLSKYLKTIQQANLNASVKEVELAKARLDFCDLVCPVNGLVLDDGNNVPGLNVTPSSSAFMVLDLDSQKIRVEIPLKQVPNIQKTHHIIPLKGKFLVDLPVKNPTEVLPGMTMTVEI